MVKRIRTLYRSRFFFTALLIIPLFCEAQKTYEATGDIKVAKQFFLFGDYATALKEFQFLYALDSTVADYYYPLGICYLNTNIDKTKAIPFLEKVVAQKDFDEEAMYQLGAAYQSSYRFDDAIDCFKKFKTLAPGKDKNFISADRRIEMCNNGKELIQHPVNVTFENVGAKINSPYPDYNPFINKNETAMYYASKRSGNNGDLLDYDGYNTADVFASENSYGEWSKGRRLAPTFNTPLVEETVGMSADAKELFIYADNLDAKLQTVVSVREGKSFQTLKPLGSSINAGGDGATAACVTPDKKIIFFASARPEGVGGIDIYMANLLPTGQWGPAKNLGKTINSQYDESYPYITPDGKTLYFASEGHNSMGGYDIFRSEWDREKNTFSEPVNIGYPVNTPDDNTTICFTGSGRYAYISALRKDSYGNLDIYRVTFNDIIAGYTTVKANLVVKDSVDMLSAMNKNIKITVQDASTQELTGNYKPNKNGRFIVILKPGEYTITINCDGYQQLKESIKIENREMPVKEITRTFRLTSI